MNVFPFQMERTNFKVNAREASMCLVISYILSDAKATLSYRLAEYVYRITRDKPTNYRALTYHLPLYMHVVATT